MTAIRQGMLVESVFQYRTLTGKCELGVGLDWDEIELLAQVAQAFAPRDLRNGRRFRREEVSLDAIVRGDRIHDPVVVCEIGPGGIVLGDAPFITRGEEVEIVVEVDDASYRFSARGVWLRDDGEDYRVGLQFIGMPVRLHRVAVSKHQQDVIDRISAAA